MRISSCLRPPVAVVRPSTSYPPLSYPRPLPYRVSVLLFCPEAASGDFGSEVLEGFTEHLNETEAAEIAEAALAIPATHDNGWKVPTSSDPAEKHCMSAVAPYSLSLPSLLPSLPRVFLWVAGQPPGHKTIREGPIVDTSRIPTSPS